MANINTLLWLIRQGKMGLKRCTIYQGNGRYSGIAAELGKKDFITKDYVYP